MSNPNDIVPSVIEIYNPDGTLKRFYQIGSGDLVGFEFALDDSGCREFLIFFSEWQDISRNDVVKFKIFDNTNYFFTGVIRKVPIDGSTKLGFNYSGFGFNDYLVRINTDTQSYSGQTIKQIVDDLVDNVITVKTPIVKNVAKIDTLNISTTTINFDYIPMTEALDQLRKLANSDGNDYRVGVDEDGEFFFKARDTTIIENLVVGKNSITGIVNYEPDDIDEPRTKLYVKKKDGTFYKTYTSTEDNDIYEEKLTAPDIADADIDLWAAGILIEKEITTRQASITWPIETSSPTLLIADGSLRIVSNILEADQAATLPDRAWGDGLYGSGPWGSIYPGRDLNDVLIVKEVKYSISSDRAIRQIQLGALPVELDRQILQVRKNIDDLRVSLGR